MADEAAAGSAGPPEAAALLRLSADDWAVLLVHVRPALHDLDESDVTRVVARLRAAPTSRLSSGRTRQELAELLAAGGAPWRALRARLVGADLPAGLHWLIAPEAQAPAPVPPSPAAGDEATRDAELEGLRDELDRVRKRSRELVEQRDEARRQLSGAEARLRGLEQRLAAAEADLGAARAERDERASEVATASHELQRAVEREQRRSETRIGQLEDELRELRRREEDRRDELQRLRQRAQRPGDEAPPPPTEASAEHGGVLGVRPGRPTQLPADLHPATRAYAEALLEPGRVVFVDGYNVTRTHRSELGLSQQREWLVAQAGVLAVRRRLEVTVVFDGSGGVPRNVRQPRDLTVVFSTGGLSADDEIDFRVAAMAVDQPVVVVTDDRELQTRVRSLGADVIGTAPFVGMLG